jgi:hemerythrin-like domain-containing protein
MDKDSRRFEKSTQQEHGLLRGYVDKLYEAADAVGDIPLPALQQRIGDVETFLTHHLIPHAEAEDQVIYPLVATMLGTLEGVSAMNRDHAEIRTYTQELVGLEPRLSEPSLKSSDAKAFRRILYGLAALLRLHLAQEDVYLRLLNAHLAPNVAQSTWDALEEATRKAEARTAEAPAGQPNRLS